MKNQRKQTAGPPVRVVVAVVVAVFICSGVLLGKIVLKNSGHKKQRQIRMVTLLKPPPPPKIREKPPEPEVKKKEEIIEELEETPPEEMEDQSLDDVPPGDELGLDTDGTEGSDEFGMTGKKGGRALIGGSGSGRYAWYYKIIIDEFQKVVNKIMLQKGGVPEESLQALVRIVLDQRGMVVESSIIGSSGNPRLDDAVKEALHFIKISEPPPLGMARAMRFKISSSG